MSITKSTQLLLLFIGGCICFTVALPLSEGRIGDTSVEVDEPVYVGKTKILYPSDTSCPGRGYSGGGYIRSESKMISESYPALPRSIPKDSVLAVPLEEYARSKRHTTDDGELTEDSAEAVDILEQEIDGESKTNTSEVLSQVDLAREVDLVFLVDVTGSMSPYIIGVRDSINDIVNDLLNSSLTEEFVEDLRLSFVGYRDFTDGEDQFTILPFTRNVTKFRDFVDETPASGGGSTPEDVYGGLDMSLKLKWGEPTRTRLIFHIADAPGHGCELHLLSSDDFPGGDPKERTAEALFSEIKKMDVQYFFGNITTDTDVMMAKFSEAYGSEIKTFDIGVSRSYGFGGGYGMSGGADAAPAAARSIYESVKHAVGYSVREKASGSSRK